MDIDPKNAAQKLYGAAALSVFIALSSWLCCFVGPVAGIAVGMLTRRQARWYEALMEPDEYPAAAGQAANLAGAFAIGLSVFELLVIIGLRLFAS